jgi:hypothetical protein
MGPAILAIPLEDPSQRQILAPGIRRGGSRLTARFGELNMSNCQSDIQERSVGTLLNHVPSFHGWWKRRDTPSSCHSTKAPASLVRCARRPKYCALAGSKICLEGSQEDATVLTLTWETTRRWSCAFFHDDSDGNQQVPLPNHQALTGENRSEDVSQSEGDQNEETMAVGRPASKETADGSAVERFISLIRLRTVSNSSCCWWASVRHNRITLWASTSNLFRGFYLSRLLSGVLIKKKSRRLQRRERVLLPPACGATPWVRLLLPPACGGMPSVRLLLPLARVVATRICFLLPPTRRVATRERLLLPAVRGTATRGSLVQQAAARLVTELLSWLGFRFSASSRLGMGMGKQQLFTRRCVHRSTFPVLQFPNQFGFRIEFVVSSISHRWSWEHLVLVAL